MPDNVKLSVSEFSAKIKSKAIQCQCTSEGGVVERVKAESKTREIGELEIRFERMQSFPTALSRWLSLS